MQVVVAPDEEMSELHFDTITKKIKVLKNLIQRASYRIL